MSWGCRLGHGRWFGMHSQHTSGNDGPFTGKRMLGVLAILLQLGSGLAIIPAADAAAADPCESDESASDFGAKGAEPCIEVPDIKLLAQVIAIVQEATRDPGIDVDAIIAQAQELANVCGESDSRAARIDCQAIVDDAVNQATALLSEWLAFATDCAGGGVDSEQ